MSMQQIVDVHEIAQINRTDRIAIVKTGTFGGWGWNRVSYCY